MERSLWIALVAGAALAAPALAQDAPDFGDDGSFWARDGICDDPRFAGPGAADSASEADRGRDASDCQAAWEAGRLTLAGDPPTPDGGAAAPDFGDDSSSWANDGECDDPRFEGEGMATVLLAEDLGRDASDCRSLFEDGAITLRDAAGDDADAPADGAEDAAADPDFGDDSSSWANDGECDDPRFEGEGMATVLLDEDLGRDAADCRALFEDGAITLRDDADDPAGGADEASLGDPFYGDDSSEYAEDGECDDRRFTGGGMAEILEWSQVGRDATDCRVAFEAGRLFLWDHEESIAATNCPLIDFGDDSGDFPEDGECDDSRFEGRGVSAFLDPENRRGDATDCRRLCAFGVIGLRDYRSF